MPLSGQRSGATDRRTFIKRGLLGGSLALAGAAGTGGSATAAVRAMRRRPWLGATGGRQAPNILVIMVDQLRFPIGASPAVSPQAAMPNLARLRSRAVSFERHYTAANDCSPARGVLLTGLHSHQTGCMITGRSRLDPGFPTWGTLLREQGYATNWWGKWHLTPHANASLEPYGFSGGTYPSPNGAPGQGMTTDPLIASQFADWFAAAGGDPPWCSTVSFVNPHDIAWWYRFTSEVAGENSPPALVNQLPENFETPQQLLAGGKPDVQRALQETADRNFGRVPFADPGLVASWSALMNTYLLLQGLVDAQIGSVLDTLASRPDVAANTVVLFTSDHGEYGGAHGLRGKGAGAYEEAIRVPLYVSDPRGVLAAAPDAGRQQLTSSADVVGLLLTIADGSNAWRSDPHYAHVAGRHDLGAICTDPSAPGRDWILHATDEDVTEFAADPYAASAPRHVVALRTPNAKLGVYSHWVGHSTHIDPRGQQVELYDYDSPAGALELRNDAGVSPAEDALRATLENEAIPAELHAPLPTRLRHAQRRGLADYHAVERRMRGRLVRITERAPAS